MRTIKAREFSGGISREHPVSGDLLGIAKLVIIEEEFRERYEALEENPRRLSEWQAEVRRGELGDPAFTAFLRDTRDIIPVNVGAIVNLKLESDELELEGFAAFRDAVIHGDRVAALEVIAGADSTTQMEYAGRLPELYRRELRAGGALTEARNLLDAALQPPPLGLDNIDRAIGMLSDAVTNPRLLEQLPQLDADRVFELMGQLAPDEREQARGPFLNLAVIGNRFGAEAVQQVAQELGKVVSELTPTERQVIEQAIGVDPAASQFRSRYVPLLEADPTLVSEAGLALAWQVLESSFDPETAEFEIVTLGFSVGRGQVVSASFLPALVTYFTSLVPDPSRHAEVLAVLLRVVQRLNRPDDAALEAVVHSVVANFSVFVSHEASGAVAFALEFASAVGDLAGVAPAAAAASDELVRAAVAQAPFEVVKHLKEET